MSAVASRLKLRFTAQPCGHNPGMLDIPLLQSVAAQMKDRKQVAVGEKTAPVKRTSSQHFKTVKFEMNGREYQAIEQNPAKPSRWGKLAREGHHVVQFKDVETNRYVAVALDGEVHEYGRMGRGSGSSWTSSK